MSLLRPSFNLRSYYILFVGVMSTFYVIWDLIDDIVFRKVGCCYHASRSCTQVRNTRSIRAVLDSGIFQTQEFQPASRSSASEIATLF